MPSSRRIIFLDVDGTIIDHGARIAPSTVTAIRAARAAGHLVYLCTGRAAGDIHPRVSEIGFDGAVTNGGAFAQCGETVIYEHRMDRADVDRLIEFFESEDTHYFLQSHEHIYASDSAVVALNRFLAAQRAQGATDPDADRWEGAIEEAAVWHRPLQDANLDDIAKAVFASERVDMVEHAQRSLGRRFQVVRGSMPLPGGSNGEISQRGVDKGSGIQRVLEELGIDAADAVGIGDSWNDREMFQVVGTSVAMGNADPELQQLADRVTTSVLDDGVQGALVSLGLH